MAASSGSLLQCNGEEPAKHPSEVYRFITLPDADPEFSATLGEYNIEGWKLTTSYSTQSGVLCRPYQVVTDAKPVATDAKPLEKLHQGEGRWELSALWQYGVKKWPPPPVAGAEVVNPGPPLTLTFDVTNAHFRVKPYKDTNVNGQEGTIQYITVAPDKETILLDMLIESAGSNNWFTVRSIAKITENKSPLHSRKTLCLCSGGLGEDRPKEIPKGSTKVPASIPAYSTYDWVPSIMAPKQ